MRTKKEIKNYIKHASPETKVVLKWVMGTCKECKGVGKLMSFCNKCGRKKECYCGGYWHFAGLGCN